MTKDGKQTPQGAARSRAAAISRRVTKSTRARMDRHSESLRIIRTKQREIIDSIDALNHRIKQIVEVMNELVMTNTNKIVEEQNNPPRSGNQTRLIT